MYKISLPCVQFKNWVSPVPEFELGLELELELKLKLELELEQLSLGNSRSLSVTLTAVVEGHLQQGLSSSICSEEFSALVGEMILV